LTDQELLESYVSGDVSAFEELLERYERPLLRFVARYRQGMGQDGALEWARDTVQEVFVRLLRDAPGLRTVENVSAWLFRVARNLAIDEARKEIRMERRHEVAAGMARGPSVAPPPCVAEERKELCEIVTRKLLGLPSNQRDVLILKIQEGKSYREISEVTGLSTSNVGYLIHHGLKALAGQLRSAGVV